MIKDLKNNSRYIIIPKKKPLAEYRLFCFPYAGASSYIYQNWIHLAQDSIEVCPVELPGRGRRHWDRLIDNIPELITEIASDIIPFLDKPFIFFGHSMGALLSYELTKKLEGAFHLSPEHLFVAANSSPVIRRKEEVTYNLPIEQFIGKLRNLDAMPDEVLLSRELMEILVPILRADFKICETYTYVPGELLNCPVTAFYGKDDHFSTFEQMNKWSEITSKEFDIKEVEGNHFFIAGKEKQLLDLIYNKIYHNKKKSLEHAS